MKSSVSKYNGITIVLDAGHGGRDGGCIGVNGSVEKNLNLNPVPKNFVLRKLGIKVNAACDVAINGRDFSINEKEPLEFGYDSIKVHSIVFKTTGLNAVIRYMYFREDKVYQ